MSSAPHSERFIFDSPLGWDLCRQILSKRLPFSPHDYQLEGVASLLDRRDFIGVSATGSGKSGFIYMTLHVILAIIENPELCPSAQFPKNPAILVIYPTKALEEDQAQKFTAVGLTALAINGDTLDQARRTGIDLWRRAETAISLILISPEMLSTPGFQSLVDSVAFQLRLFAMGPDEAHLLCSWGLEFRKSYHLIASVRKRFKENVVLFGMTATLRKGSHKNAVCEFLGLKEGRYKFLRCSNARPDIRLVFRTWHASDSSDTFQDLDWILSERGKTLIFCPGINLGFKLLVYLWHLKTKRPGQKTSIRMYNNLNSAGHNYQIFQLLQGESEADEAQITIATDKLSVGVDVPDFRTVVILNPTSLDDLWQKAGRVGRDKTKVNDAQVFVYFSRTVMDDALGKSKATVKKGAAAIVKDVAPSDRSLQAVIAATRCRAAEINEQYENNSAVYPPCSRACLTCSCLPTTLAACKCDLCLPDTAMSDTQAASTVKPRRKPLPLSIRITTEMRQLATMRLCEFRESCWLDADEETTGMIPIESYLPDPIITTLIDALPTLYTPTLLQSFLSADDLTIQNAMAPFTHQSNEVAARSRELVELLLELHRQFGLIRDRLREERRTKRAETKKRKAETAEAEDSRGDTSDSDDGASSSGEESSTGMENARTGIILRIDPRRVMGGVQGYNTVTIECVHH